MYILGLHFGHDSSISLLKDGKIIYLLELERITKKRHTIGINYKDIIYVLNKFRLKVSDIDYCSVTSTQSIEYIFSEPNKFLFKIDIARFKEEKNNNYLSDNVLKNFKNPYVLNLIKKRKKHPYLSSLNIKSKKAKFIGSIEDFYTNKNWKRGIGINALNKLFNNNINLKKLARSMQIPIEIKINNHKIKGWLFSHHYAHASYAFYQSGLNNSIIYTNDGSLPRNGYWSGMFYYGYDNNMYPLFPHYLSVGRLYQETSRAIGFGLHDGPGKMMGLASYGKPKYYSKKFLCNDIEIKKLKIIPLNKNVQSVLNKFKLSKHDVFTKKWLTNILNLSYKNKLDIKKIGNLKYILDPINVNIASSTQKLLEDIQILVLKNLKSFLKKKNFNIYNLCMSGGTALNCPANSKIYNNRLFRKVFVPPAVHDGGLSAGSALAVYYNILQNKINRNFFINKNLAYLGNEVNFKQLKFLKKSLRKKIQIKKINNIHRQLAQFLSENKKVAVMFGKSEIGPRALGHRSILAHPGFQENWRLVNKIKKREFWRPFAPCILKRYVYKYFKNVSSISPYMLFNASVKNNLIPAVTHIDKSARIQTVTENNNKELYKILTYFKKFTNLPVLLNTSFNGPGQPIIDDINDAIELYLNSNIDFLAIESFMIKKNDQ